MGDSEHPITEAPTTTDRGKITGSTENVRQSKVERIKRKREKGWTFQRSAAAPLTARTAMLWIVGVVVAGVVLATLFNVSSSDRSSNRSGIGQATAPRKKTMDETAGEDVVRSTVTNLSKARTDDSARVRMESLARGVALDVKPVVGADRKVTVRGSTNLPEGTKLMVSISTSRPLEGSLVGETESVVQDGAFETRPLGRVYGAGKMAVQNGGFVAGPRGPDQTPALPDGIYIAEVVVPIPSTQPDTVRAIIGQNGENLKGRLVERDELLGMPAITASSSFFVGRDRGTARRNEDQQLGEQRAEAKAILADLRRLEKMGRDMESLRGDDLPRLRRCGDLMRERQPKVRALNKRLDRLPLRLALSLAVPSNLELCVSCVRDALDTCNIARGAMKEAEKTIAGWR